MAEADQDLSLEVDKTWVVVPVYNNCDTILDVVVRCRKVHPRVLVIDDGSTDADISELLKDIDVHVLAHDKNRGKGVALRTAFEWLASMDADYAISIDADGQHYPEEIPRFFPLLEGGRPTIVIGCRDLSGAGVPKSSRFGRWISNFWMWIETGRRVGDSQSGFRAYPVKVVNELPHRSNGFAFEMEVVVRALWAGVELKKVPVSAWYPEDGTRISHFRLYVDDFRIACLHFHLVGLRMLPLGSTKLVLNEEGRLHRAGLKSMVGGLLKEHSTPSQLGWSAAVGAFLAVLPILGLHIMVIIWVTNLLRLNRVMALSVQHLFMPPLSPFLCIELGHWLLHGAWLTDISLKTITLELPQRFGEWLVGSLILAPVFAALTGLATFAVARLVSRRPREQ